MRRSGYVYLFSKLGPSAIEDLLRLRAIPLERRSGWTTVKPSCLGAFGGKPSFAVELCGADVHREKSEWVCSVDRRPPPSLIVAGLCGIDVARKLRPYVRPDIDGSDRSLGAERTLRGIDISYVRMGRKQAHFDNGIDTSITFPDKSGAVSGNRRPSRNRVGAVCCSDEKVWDKRPDKNSGSGSIGHDPYCPDGQAEAVRSMPWSELKSFRPRSLAALSGNVEPACAEAEGESDSCFHGPDNFHHQL